MICGINYNDIRCTRGEKRTNSTIIPRQNIFIKITSTERSRLFYTFIFSAHKTINVYVAKRVKQ